MLGCRGDFVRIGGVEGIAEVEQRKCKRIARVGEHKHIAAVLRVPKNIPSGKIGFVHHILIINNAYNAPEQRNGIFVVRVEICVLVSFVNVLVVRHIVEIYLFEHTLAYHSADHIVGGNDYIVVGGACAHFGVQLLVGGKEGVVHLNAGQLLKILVYIHEVDRVVCEKFTPVADVYFYSLPVELFIVFFILNLCGIVAGGAVCKCGYR